MNYLSRGRNRLIIVSATVATVLAAVPVVASAQNSLALNIDPAIPAKGKPFQLIATGTSQTPFPDSGALNDLYFGFGPGSFPCASTAGLEYAQVESENADRVVLTLSNGASIGDGPFDVRETYSGGATSESGRIIPKFAQANGLAVGHYRACGYINFRHQNVNQAPVATARLEFTVGGTCASAIAKQKRAKKALTRAKKRLAVAHKQLARTKKAAVKKRARRARAKVRRARAKVRFARGDREALC